MGLQGCATGTARLHDSRGHRTLDSSNRNDQVGRGTMRIAAVGDVHCGKNSHGTLQPVFAKVAEMADVLLLAGDLTNYGTPEEIEVLTGELRVLGRMPVIAVFGNHDYESDQQDTARKILEAA